MIKKAHRGQGEQAGKKKALERCFQKNEEMKFDSYHLLQVVLKRINYHLDTIIIRQTKKKSGEKNQNRSINIFAEL